jgi:hypothetical protein
VDYIDMAAAVRRRQQATPSTDMIVENAMSGAQRLARITAAWNACPPTSVELSEARNAMEGVRISLLALETQITPPPRAA